MLRRSIRVAGKVRKITGATVTHWSDQDLAELRHLLDRRRQLLRTAGQNDIDRQIVSMLVARGCAPWRVLSFMEAKPWQVAFSVPA
ncbi:MAG: hypothetical protein ACREJM_06635 [Candidatus Saccharimonadales bacterium]